MRFIGRFLISTLLLLALQSPATAGDKGTADEAKAMVDRAVALIESQGASSAYATFNDGKDGFRDRDLYVFVADFQGKLLAHGAKKQLVGKSLLNLKDPDGKAFMQEFISVGKGSGSGWVDYKWPNPVTDKVEQKSSYIQRVGDTLVGVGIYK